MVGSVEIASNTGTALGCMELWVSFSSFVTWKVNPQPSTHFTSTAVFEGSQVRDSYVHASHFMDVESEVDLVPRVLNPQLHSGLPHDKQPSGALVSSSLNVPYLEGSGFVSSSGFSGTPSKYTDTSV